MLSSALVHLIGCGLERRDFKTQFQRTFDPQKEGWLPGWSPHLASCSFCSPVLHKPMQVWLPWIEAASLVIRQLLQWIFCCPNRPWILTFMLIKSNAGLVAYGLCQTGCNTVWVACCRYWVVSRLLLKIRGNYWVCTLLILRVNCIVNESGVFRLNFYGSPLHWIGNITLIY